MNARPTRDYDEDACAGCLPALRPACARKKNERRKRIRPAILRANGLPALRPACLRSGLPALGKKTSAGRESALPACAPACLRSGLPALRPACARKKTSAGRKDELLKGFRRQPPRIRQ